RGAAPGYLLLLDAGRAVDLAGMARRNRHRLALRPSRLDGAGGGRGTLRGHRVGAAAPGTAALPCPDTCADCDRVGLGCCPHSCVGATPHIYFAYSRALGCGAG